MRLDLGMNMMNAEVVLGRREIWYERLDRIFHAETRKAEMDYETMNNNNNIMAMGSGGGGDGGCGRGFTAYRLLASKLY